MEDNIPFRVAIHRGSAAFPIPPVLPVSCVLSERIARMQAAKLAFVGGSQMGYGCAGGEEMREFERAGAAVGGGSRTILLLLFPPSGGKQIGKKVHRKAVRDARRVQANCS
jgi:hypothetical protein